MQTINFQALAVLETDKQRNAAAKFLANPKRLKRHARFVIFKVLIIVLVFLLIGLPVSAIILGPAGVVAIIFISLVLLYHFGQRQQDTLHKAANEFATVNGWRVQAPPQVDIECITPKSIKSILRDQWCIAGILSGVQFYLHSITVRDKSRDFRMYQILTLQTSAPMPFIVLDANANNLLGSNLEGSERRKQLKAIQLEGNFQKYFRVAMESDNQINVLSFITPDIMEYMINKGIYFDIEVNGQYTHIINSYAPVLTYSYTKELMEFGQYFAEKLAHKDFIQQNTH